MFRWLTKHIWPEPELVTNLAALEPVAVWTTVIDQLVAMTESGQIKWSCDWANDNTTVWKAKTKGLEFLLTTVKHDGVLGPPDCFDLSHGRCWAPAELQNSVSALFWAIMDARSRRRKLTYVSTITSECVEEAVTLHNLKAWSDKVK